MIFCLLLGVYACGKDTNPEHEPKMSELAGTWTQDSAGRNLPSGLLLLNTNYTCVAKNYVVVVQMDGLENISGSGRWELADDSRGGWQVVVTIPELGMHGVPVQNGKAPFLLGIKGSRPLARRLEDTPR